MHVNLANNVDDAVKNFKFINQINLFYFRNVNKSRIIVTHAIYTCIMFIAPARQTRI